jgi:ribosomal protein S18 acetylase RimI-like enzyme
MFEIKEAKKEDLDEMAKVLVPAFSDKALAMIGDEKKAEKFVPVILEGVGGLKLLAYENETTVGAIVVSVKEIELPPQIFKFLRKELGLFKAIRAVFMFRNYEKSLPKRKLHEARLEAVGVAEGVRGKGIATELITNAEKRLARQGLDHFGLSVKTSNPAVRLYKRLGFEEVKKLSNKLGEWYYMRKPLYNTDIA